MKKNFKVIQINGIRGLLVAFFTLSCLAAGFVVFPAFLAMTIWNYFASSFNSPIILNFAEGLMLWAIIAFSIYIFNKKKFIVSFNAQQELSDDEIKAVVSKIKAHTLNPSIMRDFNIQNFNQQKNEVKDSVDEKTEVHASENNKD